MLKSKIDWVIAINSLIIGEENTKPHLFTLKKGKEVAAKIFFYRGSIVHGTNLAGEDFKFNVSELLDIKALQKETAAKKKEPPKKSARRFAGHMISTTSKGTTFETLTRPPLKDGVK
jgi:hypothetical protein